jgi:hypothetical protein
LLLLFAFMTTARCALFASVSFCEDKFGFLDSTDYIYFVRPLHRIFHVHAHHRSQVRSLTIPHLLDRPPLISIPTEALGDLRYTITAYLPVRNTVHIQPTHSVSTSSLPSSANTIRYECHGPNNITFHLVASRTTKTTISTLITSLASA